MLKGSRGSLRAALTVVGLLAATFLGISPAVAQVDTGAILGTVMDPSGAVIPGTKVTATNEDTGVAISTTTSDVGSYVFTPIRIGTYSITAEKEGFEIPITLMCASIITSVTTT
ncbi:MAG TPA: carboxypeptidase-like regulatory domain-containing protein [Terriglobia bacterium]|nr:carboxypeptidase-like regulatory domain-containing protein [Terriglobia bacterium]